MSIDGFNNQMKWVNKRLDSLESMIENGADVEDCISELQDLRGETNALIEEVEEIIEGISSL